MGQDVIIIAISWECLTWEIRNGNERAREMLVVSKEQSPVL